MQPEILEKLRAHVSAPFSTECAVVYLMVELRKLMDQQGSGNQYPLLRLFCNWTVHTSIDRSQAAEPFLLEFDKAAQSMKTGNGLPLDFLESLSLSNFRDQMREFLAANNLPTSVVTRQDQWDAFLDLYSAVVSDCLRIPGHADSRSGGMAIGIPG